MKRRIIVVEDEEDLAELVAYHLRREGYDVEVHGEGIAGLEAIEARPPDLIVLDLMLPGMDGFEICRQVRRNDSLAHLSVLMMTARGEDVDVVTGLEIGADDYLVKPVSPRVLVARVRALLRRSEETSKAAATISAGPIVIDPLRHEVRVEGSPVEMTHTEFKILRFLAAKPGRVRSRSEVLEAIGERHVLERTVDVHVASLRRKLGSASERVETVRGVGYRMKD